MVFIAITTCLCLYVGFGVFSLNAFGKENQEHPLITDFLSQSLGKPVSVAVLLMFMSNLVFSYPLQLYPVHIIIENYLYSSWPKSKKRMNMKNLTRTILVSITVIFTLSLGKKIDKFLALLRAVGCTPIAFTLPAAFHLKACA